MSRPNSVMPSLQTPPGNPEFLNISASDKCAVCKCVLRDAMQTSCGHRMCESCMFDLLDGSEGPVDCPVNEDDCEPQTREVIIPDPGARRQVRNFPVYCANQSLGCKWQKSWKELEQHEAQCQCLDHQMDSQTKHWALSSSEDEDEYSPVMSDEEVTQETSNQYSKGNGGEKRGRPVGTVKRKMDETVGHEQKKRTKKALIPVEQLITFMCCSLFCMADVALETLSAIRAAFQEKTQLEKSQYITDWIRNHTADKTTNFFIGSRKCCLSAWSAVHGLTKSSFYNIKKRFEDGKTTMAAGNWKGTLSPKGVMAMVWIETFAAKNGDKMPNHESIHLPCCLTKTTVYQHYLSDQMDEDGDCLSKTQFFLIWRKHLHHIKIPKSTRFTVCDVCAKLTDRLQKATTKEERQQVKDYRESHLRQQKMERQKYYKHISKSKSNPDKYMSVIIDAMDQDKTSVPHFLSVPKTLSSLWMLRMNLTGVIVHGIGIFGFFDCFKYSHGSSYTISVLVHTLTMMTRIPSTLYLQLDNCPGSNKNRFMLGFLAALVQAGIFRKVKLSFLMVGHTHEDIDQLFSRFSYWLRHNPAMTIPDLLKGFENCYQPGPKAMTMDTVFNMQEWLEIQPITNHSKPHIFKIQKVDGHTKIYYKQWSTDKNWQQTPGELLMPSMDVMAPMELIKPQPEKIDDRVESDIQTMMSFYQNQPGREWWAQFFKDLHEEVVEEKSHHKMEELMSLSIEDADRLTHNALEGLPDLRVTIPKVHIGKKQQMGYQEEESSMRIDDFVLCDLDKYSDEWPQIGQVVAIDQGDVQVHWLKGSMTSAWTPVCRRVKGARGGKTEPFLESIKKTDVWHYGFSLTPSGKLTKQLKDMIANYK